MRLKTQRHIDRGGSWSRSRWHRWCWAHTTRCWSTRTHCPHADPRPRPPCRSKSSWQTERNTDRGTRRAGRPGKCAAVSCSWGRVALPGQWLHWYPGLRDTLAGAPRTSSSWPGYPTGRSCWHSLASTLPRSLWTRSGWTRRRSHTCHSLPMQTSSKVTQWWPWGLRQTWNTPESQNKERWFLQSSHEFCLQSKGGKRDR